MQQDTIGRVGQEGENRPDDEQGFIDPWRIHVVVDNGNRAKDKSID
jgi:hypothetical protein